MEYGCLSKLIRQKFNIPIKTTLNYQFLSQQLLSSTQSLLSNGAATVTSPSSTDRWYSTCKGRVCSWCVTMERLYGDIWESRDSGIVSSCSGCGKRCFDGMPVRWKREWCLVFHVQLYVYFQAAVGGAKNGCTNEWTVIYNVRAF